MSCLSSVLCNVLFDREEYAHFSLLTYFRLKQFFYNKIGNFPDNFMPLNEILGNFPDNYMFIS